MLLVAPEPRRKGLVDLRLSGLVIELDVGEAAEADCVKCVPGPSTALGSGSMRGSMTELAAYFSVNRTLHTSK